MSRHRNVRGMNYADEYYDEDDDYSQSYDDNYCISPGTVAQFTFNRDKDVHLASYMGNDEIIPEEEEGDKVPILYDSTRNLSKKLSDIDHAKLNSCMEEVRNIVGETTTDQVIAECILRHNFNTEASLNELLTQSEVPKPQRQPRENRRNRSQGDDEELFEKSPSMIVIPHTVVTSHKTSVINTPPQKSIDSLSLLLSQMSTQNSNKTSKSASSTHLSAKLERDNLNIKPKQNIYATIERNSFMPVEGDKHHPMPPVTLSKLATQNQSLPLQLVEGEQLRTEKHGQYQSTLISNESDGFSLHHLANRHNTINTAVKFGLIVNETKPKIALNEMATKHELSVGTGLSGLSNNYQNYQQNFPCATVFTSNISNTSKHQQLSYNPPLSVMSTNTSSTSSSLAQLAQSNLSKSTSTVSNLVKGSSLTGTAIAGNRQSEHSKIKSRGADGNSPNSNDISLACLTVKKLSKPKKETVDVDVNKKKIPERKVSEAYFDETENKDSDLFFDNNAVNFSLDFDMIKSPSNLGKVFAMKYKPPTNPKRVSNKFLLFQYSQQTTQMIKKRKPPLHKIKAFSFNTPSPDDIVRERQKAAFK